jgi:cell filamentation protein
MQDKYGITNDTACYPNSTVLVNHLGIQDAEELAEVEKALTESRAALFEPDFSAFDLATLQAIHRHLFQDIYPWAGELRTVDISKGNTRFCTAAYIEKEANKLLRKLANEDCLVDLPLPALLERLADYYCELNVIHPFREGNGRTQRLFFDLIAINAGYGLDWSQVEQDEWIQANIAGYLGDLQPLQILFQRIISDI